MKKILFRLAYACLFLSTVFSCNNEETIPQQTITFTIRSDTEKYWIALSDASGKVLTWKAMINGVTETLTYAAKEPVMLSMIGKSVYYDHTSITSYAAIQPGDYSYSSEIQSASGLPGTFVIHRDRNDFNIVVESEGYCFSGSSFQDDTRIDLSLCDDTTSLLLWCTRNGINDETPRYLYKSDITKNGSLTLDMDLYNQLPVMKTQVVAYDKPFIYGSSLVFGNTIKKKKQLMASAYFPGTNPVSKIKLYYPELIGSLFDSYIFLINLRSEEYVHNFISKEGTVPDASYPALDVQFDFADSSKITPQLISTRVSGKADYTKVVFQYKRTEAGGGLWFIYAPFTNEISIKPPSFPEDLKVAAKLDLVSKMKASQIGFGEDKEVGGYEGLYKAQLSTSNNNLRTSKIDNRSRVYQLRPYVAIYGRKASPEYP